MERTACKSTFFKMEQHTPIAPRYLQDNGLFRHEAAVDMNASQEPAASIFAVGAQKARVSTFTQVVTNGRNITLS
jgi:hypothetical protein